MQLAQINNINRTNDYAFKRIFGSEEGKEVLISFLNAVLKPPSGQELVDLELIDREMDPAYILEKGARLDVLARTSDGTLINIEIQVANQYNINKRTLFYWASLYRGQLTSGQNFSILHKTITVNILGFNWFSGDERYHRTYHIRDDTTGELLSDDLEIHFLELKKVKHMKRDPSGDLENWMIYLNNLEGPEMEAIAMRNPGIKKALTIEQIFMKSEKDRRIYELIEKAKRDEISALAGARAEGEAKGEAKGRAEGEAKGEARGRAEGEAKGRAMGKAEGKAGMAQEAICKYLDARFGENSLDLQKQVEKISELAVLDAIIDKIFTADSLQEAYSIINSMTN
jgi:predicted transposase/invertase (TIGR01784 family)